MIELINNARGMADALRVSSKSDDSLEQQCAEMLHIVCSELADERIAHATTLRLLEEANEKIANASGQIIALTDMAQQRAIRINGLNKIIAESREQKPIAFLIRGDECDEKGFLSGAMVLNHGEFSQPVYPAPIILPSEEELRRENEELKRKLADKYPGRDFMDISFTVESPGNYRAIVSRNSGIVQKINRVK